MGGNLSFVLTMLDENNSGWIFNAMHSREGCYTYIKEVIKERHISNFQKKNRSVWRKRSTRKSTILTIPKRKRTIKKKNQNERVKICWISNLLEIIPKL